MTQKGPNPRHLRLVCILDLECLRTQQQACQSRRGSSPCFLRSSKGDRLCSFSHTLLHAEQSSGTCSGLCRQISTDRRCTTAILMQCTSAALSTSWHDDKRLLQSLAECFHRPPLDHAGRVWGEGGVCLYFSVVGEGKKERKREKERK